VERATEDILGCAVAEGGFSLEAVASTGWQVLQFESAADRIAPSCVRMTGVSVGSSVIGAVQFVSRGTDVRRTPSLIDAQVADDIGNVIAKLSIALEVVGGSEEF